MYKILIVDDDKDIRDSLYALLSNEFIITTAGNSKEARAMLTGPQQPDLMLLDVRMESEHEGFELASEIFDRFKERKIPIILITSLEVFTVSAAIGGIARDLRTKYPEQNLNILVLRSITGEVLVDYQSMESGQSVCIEVDGFHPKPINPAKLKREINLILSRYKESKSG